MQGLHICGVAHSVLKDKGWAIVDQEESVSADNFTGRLDLRCWHKDQGDAIIELKTGQSVGAAWLQLGGYIAALIGRCPSRTRLPSNQGGVLHVPRQSVNRDVTGTLEMRNAGLLIDAWKRIQGRVIEVMHGRNPLLTPGLHCMRCSLKQSCPVRAS